MLAGSIDLTSKVTGALPQANIADEAINEAKQSSNAPTNGYFTAQSVNTGGLTWAEASGGSWHYFLQQMFLMEQAQLI